MSVPKKKCRQYSVEYLKYGFISSPGNSILPMCLLWNKTLSNDSMKPSKLKEHLMKIHSDKKDKDLTIFLSSPRNIFENAITSTTHMDNI